MMKDKPMWVIRAGQNGEADALFREQNVVALGWREISSLAVVAPTREAFKVAVAQAYPQIQAVKPGAIANSAGQLFRFVYEIKVGDLVAYPSKLDRQIYFGEISSDYRFDSKLFDGFAHIRSVRWIKSVSREQFSQGALYEINSALTLFVLKTYVDEFRKSVSNQPSETPITTDETVEKVAADVEETTRDFVLKTLSQQLKGHPLAAFLAHLLETMGYHTRVSPPGPDGGIDILAHKDELGFEPPIIKVQVKSTDSTIGDPEVSALYGKVGNGEHGLFITLGTFSSRAQQFALSKSNLRLVDGRTLVEMILRHYDKFDSSYKALLPLKRVYVADTSADDAS